MRAVCSVLEHTAADGKRYKTQYYNLDAIISVGYRVNSARATRFRIWATHTLKDHLIRGGIRRPGNRAHAYDEATALVTRVRDLMRRAMQEKEFMAWIEIVRAKQKAKRNFMQPMAKVTPAREWAGGSIPQ